MKILNNIFAGIYLIVFIGSVWFGINWVLTRGLSTMFDDPTEAILAVLYFVALLFSIFMHIKLKNNFSIANKICTVITSVNVISLVGLILLTFNSGSDAGLVLVAWMFVTLGLWVLSLIFGISAIKNTDYNLKSL